jgi:virginiamycin B lyase
MDSVTFADQKKSRMWKYVAVLALALIAALGLWRLAGPHAAGVVEFKMPEPRDTPTVLAVAPDGAVWFTIDFAAAIGRLREGKVERLPLPKVNIEPIGIAIAPDGAAWFTDSEARQVSRMAPDGKITSITLETPVVRLGKIAVGRDGAVWFAEATAFSITRIKDGKVKRHIIESARGGPLGVAVAPDGSAWATLQSANQLLHITPDGQMNAIDIPTRSSSPGDITVDGNGVVWFNEFRGNRIGRLADGRIDEFPLGAESVGVTGLAVAADGSVWFGMLRKGSLGRLREGKVTEFKLPREAARPYSVGVDGAGNVWYTDITGYVGMLPASAAKK